MSSIKLEQIKKEIAVEGWKLISTKYSNLDSEMEFECPKGHRVFAPWKEFRKRRECPECNQLVLEEQNKLLKIPKTPGLKRVIAFDQASKVSGYAIYDGEKLIRYGVFKAKGKDEIARCSDIKKWMISLIEEWHPDEVGIEGIQLQSTNGKDVNIAVNVFQTLAHLQGILLETLYTMNIPYKLCPTNTWRNACGVRGSSREEKKKSMQELVKKWYGLEVTDDESDAIGIGKYMVSPEPAYNDVEIHMW